MCRWHVLLRGVGPGDEVVDPALGMACDNAFERIGQVGVRVHVVEPAGADQRGDDCPVLAAAIGAGEERVLPVQGDRADGALDGVGVDLEASVVEEAPETVPELQRVPDRLGEARLARQAAELRLEPGPEGLDDGAGPGITRGAAGVGVLAADLRLDRVECSDALERLLGDRRRAGLGDLVELPPDVRPAVSERRRAVVATRVCKPTIGGVAVDRRTPEKPERCWVACSAPRPSA